MSVQQGMKSPPQILKSSRVNDTELTISCERLCSCVTQESYRALPKVGLLQTPYSYIGAELCTINYQYRSATVAYKSDHGLVKEVVPLSLVRINALD